MITNRSGVVSMALKVAWPVVWRWLEVIMRRSTVGFEVVWVWLKVISRWLEVIWK